jgi:hypothetical protein
LIRSDSAEARAPLTLEILKALIKVSFESRSVIFKPHARYQTKERKISFQDVKHVCVNARFERAPRYENEKQNWIYELTGKDLDEVETTIVIAVDNDERVVTIITCY